MEKKILYLLLFLLPTQLAYHFWPQWAFVFGIRVDLLAPAIYLTDILSSILIVLNLKFIKKYFKYLFPVLLFAIINSFFSISPLESAYRWLKVFEFIFLGIYFANQKSLEIGQIVHTLFYSSIFFSLIGIAQFLKGGTIGGLLYYFGERSFSMGTPGIALVSLNGIEYLRAYSTFSHPNSLAGFLGGTLLLVLLSGKLKKNFANFLGILIVIMCFLITFSISAYIGIFVAFSFYLFSKNKYYFKTGILCFLFIIIVSSLILPLVSSWLLITFPSISQNLSQRLDLAFVAGKVIGSRFLVGGGLGTFIENIPTYKGIFSYSWLVQPVHNIFLLFFAETGILGLLVFCLVIYKTIILQIKTKYIYLLLPTIFILFTGLFDHYSLTLQQNLLFVSLLLGLSFKISSWLAT